MSKPSLKHPGILLATWFGSGYITPAPGTWGSAATLPFILCAYWLGGFWAACIFTTIITAIGFWACAEYERRSGEHDCKHVVIDEAAGQSLALLPVLWFVGLSPVLIVLAFAFFRLFDILKPWPVCYFDEQVAGAKGVMMDDIAAGIFAAGCVMGAIYAGVS